MPAACGRKNGVAPIQELYELTLNEDELAFIYLGYAGIILRSQKGVLAFDVSQECIRDEEIAALKKLDLQFYSHTHWDHWDPGATLKILERTGAKIVAEPQVVTEMGDSLASDALTAARPGQPLTINRVEVSAIEGVHPRPITLFHVKWGAFRIFHGADSGYVPLGDYPSDLAFVPVGTPSPSCSPKNALNMVLDVRPQAVVAMHGNQKQLREFRRLVERQMPETEIILPEPCELVRVSPSAPKAG
jgi:L-ascorbate metabolism protein UlaG (beta-lactamase superfamily)